jgi:hypothetical protein
VGRVLYDGPMKISPKSKKTVIMEVRLSHITAVFNLFRFLLTDAILMEIRGHIEIKVLWMQFQIPVDDALSVPRSKFKLAMEDAGIKPQGSSTAEKIR